VLVGADFYLGSDSYVKVMEGAGKDVNVSLLHHAEIMREGGYNRQRQQQKTTAKAKCGGLSTALLTMMP
jgi:hypothetical protein